MGSLWRGSAGNCSALAPPHAAVPDNIITAGTLWWRSPLRGPVRISPSIILSSESRVLFLFPGVDYSSRNQAFNSLFFLKRSEVGRGNITSDTTLKPCDPFDTTYEAFDLKHHESSAYKRANWCLSACWVALRWFRLQSRSTSTCMCHCLVAFYLTPHPLCSVFNEHTQKAIKPLQTTCRMDVDHLLSGAAEQVCTMESCPGVGDFCSIYFL